GTTGRPRTGCGSSSTWRMAGPDDGSAGLAGADALDDAEPEPLRLLDLEAEFAHVEIGTAAEVLAGQRDGDPLVQPLHGAQRGRRGGHVVDQQQAAAGAQDTRHLG